VLCVIAVAFGVLWKSGEVDVTGVTTWKLAEGPYDLKVLDAPKATGFTLRVLASLLGNKVIGPPIRRILLNGNHIEMLRELALQVDRNEVGVVYFPMVRLNNEQRARHEALAVDDGNVSSLLLTGHTDLKADWRKSKGKGFQFRSSLDYARAYRRGDTTVVEAMKRFLRGVEETRELGIWIHMNESEIMSQAAESDKRFQSGNPLSVLDGVPVAFKDMVNIAGHRRTDGTVGGDTDALQDTDGIIASRFRKLGAIIVGTTVMTEFGVTPLGWSAHYQGPRNPYNPRHFPGGSSSGSAVAVAAGLVPIAVGFDGGGSIRIPSALSGCFGLSATFGRIAIGSGLPSGGATTSTMLHAGPLAATATDLALGYAAMAPSVPGHFYSTLYGEGGGGLPPPHVAGLSSPVKSLKGLRVGVFWEWFEDADDEVVAACVKALDVMQAQGAVLVNITIPHMQALSMSHGIGISVEFSHLNDLLYSNGHPLEPNTRVTLALGNAISGLEFVSANRLRGWALQYFQKLFESKVDVIATPTVPFAAPELPKDVEAHGVSDTPTVVQMMKFIFVSNLIGAPGLSVPVGYSSNDLPLGLHLLAAHWDDATLISAAAALEELLVRDGRRRPKHHVDVLAGSA